MKTFLGWLLLVAGILALVWMLPGEGWPCSHDQKSCEAQTNCQWTGQFCVCLNPASDTTSWETPELPTINDGNAIDRQAILEHAGCKDLSGRISIAQTPDGWMIIVRCTPIGARPPWTGAPS